MRARTIGEVPRARLLAALSVNDSCGVVKNAFSPALALTAQTARLSWK